MAGVWPYEVPYTCSSCGEAVLALCTYPWRPGPAPVCGLCNHAALWDAPAPAAQLAAAPAVAARPPVEQLLQLGLLSEEALERVRAKRPHSTL